jgi:hypothetical protein
MRLLQRAPMGILRPVAKVESPARHAARYLEIDRCASQGERPAGLKAPIGRRLILKLGLRLKHQRACLHPLRMCKRCPVRVPE